MKKIRNDFALIFLGCFLSVFLFHCTKNKDEVTVFDGMHLTYKSMSSCNEDTYLVSIVDEGRYKLLEKEGCPGDKILSPEEEYFFDKYGKVSKSTADERDVGKRIEIWIPPSELNGSRVPPSFGDSNAEVERRVWGKWNVLGITSKRYGVLVEIFYEVKTGFKVGSYTGAMPGTLPNTWVLVDTNANIPTVEK